MAIVLGLGIVLVGGLYLITMRTVTLVVEGVRQEVRTHQSTVGGLVGELPGSLEVQDIISPALDTPIRNGLIVTVVKARPVLIEADGHSQRILTHLVQPRDILAQAGIAVDPHDIIQVDDAMLKSEPYTTTPTNIVILRRQAFTLDDDGTTRTLYTVSRTVGGALQEANVTLYLADVITPDPSTPLDNLSASTISIQRSVSVTVLADGHKLMTRTHAKTVGAALTEIGIVPVGLDYVIPDEATMLNSDVPIRVVRVAEELQVDRSVIDFKRIIQIDPTLPIGTEKVLQPGIQGIRERRVKIRREDGVEVSRSAPEEVIIRPARDEITALGPLNPAPTVPSGAAK